MLYRIASYIQQQPFAWYRTIIVIHLVDFDSYYRGIFMVLTVSIINRDARINASGIVDYAIVFFISFLSVKHTLIDHSQTIFSPQIAASYQDFPARSAIHDLFGKKIIGLMSFLSGELEILYCGDKRVFVSFFKLCHWDSSYKRTHLVHYNRADCRSQRMEICCIKSL